MIAEDYQALKSLAERWDNCAHCDLCENRDAPLFDTLFEPSEYNGIVFIGEGPGSKEQARGVPFCGPAGYVLDSILKRLGLTRKQVYVTNIVKHRAVAENGKDRTPTEEEGDTCKQLWLGKELALLKPKVIIPLGGTAAYHFKIAGSINQVAGTRQYFRGVLMVPLQHPAWPLYQPNAKPVMLEAVLRLRQILLDDGLLEEVVGG